MPRPSRLPWPLRGRRSGPSRWGAAALLSVAVVGVTAALFAGPSHLVPGDPPVDLCVSNRLPGPLTEFPDEETTGVPDGTELRRVEGDHRTTADGQVISKLDITGRLYVDHDDVVVKCTWVRNMTVNEGTGLRIWLSTLGDPKGVREGSALKWSDYTLRRVDIMGTFDGLKAEGDVDVRDSFIHDLFRTTDATQDSGMTHNDGVQISQGTNMVFKHNTFYNWSFTDGEEAGENIGKTPFGDGSGFTTSAFLIAAKAGPVRDLLIENNLIRGRTSKPFIVVERGDYEVKDVRIRDNVIGRESRDLPKVFPGRGDVTVTGNVFTDGSPAER